MGNLGNRFHVNFLGYANCFMSIIISHMKDRSISVYQGIYDTSVVEKYLDTVTVKTSKKITIPLFHLILSSPKMMRILVMSKFRS